MKQKKEKAAMTIHQSQDILVVQQDKLLTIRESDWKRLKRLLNGCKFSFGWWSNAASCAFSIAGSAILAVLTLPLPELNWVMSMMWSIVVFTTVIGIICIIAEKRAKKQESDKLEELKTTVEEMESLLE